MGGYASRLKQTACAGNAVQETQRNPSPPFTTSTLQQTASQRLGMGAAATMSAAQTLYEGGDGLGERCVLAPAARPCSGFWDVHTCIVMQWGHAHKDLSAVKAGLGDVLMHNVYSHTWSDPQRRQCAPHGDVTLS
jgi:reverse gyrase